MTEGGAKFAWGYVLAVITALLIVASVAAIQGKLQADTTHEALCNFRADLGDRIAQSRQIVQEHPEIIKQFGLTPAQVRQQIQNQQATYNALSELGCEGQ